MFPKHDSMSSLQVYARLRTSRLKEQCVTIAGDSIVLSQVKEGQDKQETYKLDGVISDDPYEVVQPFVRDSLKGLSSCIMAYGVTGSGKTFTIQGTSGSPGLIGEAVKHLFATSANISIRYYQLYGDKITDLLQPPKKKPKKAPFVHFMFDDSGRSFVVTNVSIREVKDFEDFQAVYLKAAQNRTTASTAHNATSSRSHAFLEILVETPAEDDQVHKGKLTFVDLAGAESNKPTKSIVQTIKAKVKSEKAFQEAKEINKALTNLLTCIDKLHAKTGHVPLRDSPLTKILCDVLGGNAKGLLITCLSADPGQYYETQKSLAFAQKAMKIVCHPEVTTAFKKKRAAIQDDELEREAKRIKLAEEAEKAKLADEARLAEEATLAAEALVKEKAEREAVESATQLQRAREEAEHEERMSRAAAREREAEQRMLDLQQEEQRIATQRKELEEMQNKIDASSKPKAKLVKESSSSIIWQGSRKAPLVKKESSSSSIVWLEEEQPIRTSVKSEDVKPNPADLLLDIKPNLDDIASDLNPKTEEEEEGESDNEVAMALQDSTNRRVTAEHTTKRQQSRTFSPPASRTASRTCTPEQLSEEETYLPEHNNLMLHEDTNASSRSPTPPPSVADQLIYTNSPIGRAPASSSFVIEEPPASPTREERVRSPTLTNFERAEGWRSPINHRERAPSSPFVFEKLPRPVSSQRHFSPALSEHEFTPAMQDRSKIGSPAACDVEERQLSPVAYDEEPGLSSPARFEDDDALISPDVSNGRGRTWSPVAREQEARQLSPLFFNEEEEPRERSPSLPPLPDLPDEASAKRKGKMPRKDSGLDVDLQESNWRIQASRAQKQEDFEVALRCWRKVAQTDKSRKLEQHIERLSDLVEARRRAGTLPILPKKGRKAASTSLGKKMAKATTQATRPSARKRMFDDVRLR